MKTEVRELWKKLSTELEVAEDIAWNKGWDENMKRMEDEVGRLKQQLQDAEGSDSKVSEAIRLKTFQDGYAKGRKDAILEGKEALDSIL